jgi:hypothetical protein
MNSQMAATLELRPPARLVDIVDDDEEGAGAATIVNAALCPNPSDSLRIEAFPIHQLERREGGRVYGAYSLSSSSSFSLPFSSAATSRQ